MNSFIIRCYCGHYFALPERNNKKQKSFKCMRCGKNNVISKKKIYDVGEQCDMIEKIQKLNFNRIMEHDIENKPTLYEVVTECYRLLYSKSIPRIDFDLLVKEGISKQSNFFMRFYLPEEKQVELINSVCNKYNLLQQEREAVFTEVQSGCSPTGWKKPWLKAWGVE